MASKQDRAKQFLPFDALKGLQEALREKEIEIEERKELAEESLKELQEIVNRLEKGDKVNIKYYKNKKYIDITEIVVDIDYTKKKIILSNDLKVNMFDIIQIEIL